MSLLHTQLLYHLKLVDLLSVLTKGKSGAAEVKCQRLVRFEQCIAVLLEDNLPKEIKTCYLVFFWIFRNRVSIRRCNTTTIRNELFWNHGNYSTSNGTLQTTRSRQINGQHIDRWTYGIPLFRLLQRNQTCVGSFL